MLPNKAPKAGIEQRPSEVIDANELARRWNLPASWVREQTRTRAEDPTVHTLRPLRPFRMGFT